MHLPIWAIVLLFQNFAFTFVSRARNSGSLTRHIVAAFFSNLIFIIQFAFVTDAQAEAALHGQLGVTAQIGIAIFYTIFTMFGSVLAHYFSLATEKGKSAVGANKKLAQFTAEEGDNIRRVVEAMRYEVLTVDSFGPNGTAIIKSWVDKFNEQQSHLENLETEITEMVVAEKKQSDPLADNGSVPPVPSQGMKL